MANSLEMPIAYSQGMEAGSIGHIAEYLPQIATALSGLSGFMGGDIGQIIRGALMPTAFGGAMGSSPGESILNTQARRAVGIDALSTQASEAWRTQHTPPGSSLADSIFTSLRRSQEGIDHFGSMHGSALARAGVGYLRGMRRAFGDGPMGEASSTEVDNINRIFGGLANLSPQDTMGTRMHERGTVAAMYHRGNRGQFSEDLNIDSVTENITTLTRALSDLADTMGTDVETAARRLNTTLGMDVTAAFRGVEGNLGIIMQMQQEATRSTGLGQGAIAQMVGLSMEVGMRHGGLRGGMVSETAAAVAGVVGGPMNAYGVDMSSQPQKEAELIASTASSDWAKQLSGAFAAFSARNPGITEDDFMARVTGMGTTDMTQILSNLGLGQHTPASLDHLAHTQIAEQFRTQNIEAVSMSRRAHENTILEQSTGLLSNILGEDGTDPGFRKKVEDLMTGDKGFRDLDAFMDAFGITNREEGLRLQGEVIKNTDMLFGHMGGSAGVDTTLSGRGKREASFKEAAARARMRATQDKMGGGLSGLVEYLQTHDEARAGEALMGFFGVANISKVVGMADKALGDLFTEMYDQGSPTDRKALNAAFNELITDMGDMTEEERKLALRDITGAKGDVTDTLGAIKKHTVRGKQETRRRGLLGKDAEDLTDTEALRRGAILEAGEEGEGDIGDLLGDWNPYSRRFEGEQKLLDTGRVDEEQLKEILKEAGVKQGPMEGWELIGELLKDLMNHLKTKPIAVKEEESEGTSGGG